MGTEVSNFALVIQLLNIATDKIKFRIINYNVEVPLVHHTLPFKEFDCLGIQNYRHCLEYCWVHGVKFVVMKRVYLL